MTASTDTRQNIALQLKLSNGELMPALGLGTWGMQGKEEQAVAHALAIGYRHIDTAKIYGTEQGIGRAIKKSGVPRDEIFVTTKLWNDDQGFDTALRAIDESLIKLGTNYVDLYLVHWPRTEELEGKNLRQETWRAMEAIYKSGKAKAIGVSNYNRGHLSEMEVYAEIQPAVNQIQRHPFNQQRDTVEYCEAHDIIVTNYSPLTRGRRMSEAAVEDIANTHQKTSAQVFLRWGLQHRNVVIPKAAQKKHIEENFRVFDFELSEHEMATLDSLDERMSVV